LSAIAGKAQMANLTPHILMLLWAALVASSFPVAALFNPELSASLLVGIRFLLAGLLMWLFKPQSLRLNPRAWLSYGVLGTLLAGNFVIMFVALRYAQPLNLAAIYICLPLIAYLLAALLKMESLRLSRLLLLFIVALAALVILGRAELEQFRRLEFGFGEQIYLLACLMAAAYNTLSRYVTDQQWIAADPYLTTCFSLLAGGALIQLPVLVSSDLTQFAANFTLSDGVALGYLTLFTSLITFWLLQICALKLKPSMLSAYSYQTPLLYLLAELALGITPWQPAYLLAIALLLLGFYSLAKQPD